MLKSKLKKILLYSGIQYTSIYAKSNFIYTCSIYLIDVIFQINVIHCIKIACGFSDLKIQRKN